jgi:RimJ/RimL family protein N-acetyltransferase
LTLRPGSDEEFLDLFVDVARGTLDVSTQRSVAASSVEETAQEDLDFYLSCPGERDWWRVAVDFSGEPIGFVIPSATPYARNVGYLGVLPDHWGRGHVDELLTYVTAFHRAAGATRITATTDAVNRPMVDAFTRNAYRVVGDSDQPGSSSGLTW